MSGDIFQMKYFLLTFLLFAVIVGGWVGYRATQHQKHCYTVRVKNGLYGSSGTHDELVCK